MIPAALKATKKPSVSSPWALSQNDVVDLAGVTSCEHFNSSASVGILFMSHAERDSAVPGASALPVTRRPNLVQEFALGSPKLTNLVRAHRLGRSSDWLRWRETWFKR